MEPELSVIIPFRAAGALTVRNLHATVASLNVQDLARDGYQITIVETDRKPVVCEDPPLGCETVFAFYPQRHFCKSWALNVGFRQCRAEYFLFHDADILAPPNMLGTVLRHLRQNPAVKPSYWLHDLDETMTSLVHASGPSKALNVNPEQFGSRPTPGASIGLQRECFEKIRGFHEEFRGWGGEDDEFLLRLKAVVMEPLDLGLTLRHLWHPRHNDQAEYVLNCVSLKYLYSHMPDRVSEYIANMSPRFGNIDKFK